MIESQLVLTYISVSYLLFDIMLVQKCFWPKFLKKGPKAFSEVILPKLLRPKVFAL